MTKVVEKNWKVKWKKREGNGGRVRGKIKKLKARESDDDNNNKRK